MSQLSSATASPALHQLPRDVKVLSGASLLNDIASEMIFPLLPNFLLTVLLGNRLYLGVIEGAADSVASFLKLLSGGMSDRAGWRKGFVVFGYCLAAIARPLIGVIVAPWQLLALRVGDSIGKGVRTSPRDALIADSTDPQIRGRAFGFHRGDGSSWCRHWPSPRSRASFGNGQTSCERFSSLPWCLGCW
jgi:hypothetical protein